LSDAAEQVTQWDVGGSSEDMEWDDVSCRPIPSLSSTSVGPVKPPSRDGSLIDCRGTALPMPWNTHHAEAFDWDDTVGKDMEWDDAFGSTA
jgi:hypothetical protein